MLAAISWSLASGNTSYVWISATMKHTCVIPEALNGTPGNPSIVYKSSDGESFNSLYSTKSALELSGSQHTLARTGTIHTLARTKIIHAHTHTQLYIHVYTFHQHNAKWLITERLCGAGGIQLFMVSLIQNRQVSGILRQIHRLHSFI